jgi:alkyl hydroperoxide reductase subunit AhpC
MMENLIGRRLEEFKVQAYRNGKFMEVTRESVLGKWGVFFFYPADLRDRQKTARSRDNALKSILGP